MKTLVIYLFSFLSTIAVLTNFEQNICEDEIAAVLSFENPSNSTNTYATKNNNYTQENIKLKNQDKDTILCQRLCKTNNLCFCNVLFCNPIYTDGVSYILAFLCRLNI